MASKEKKKLHEAEAHLEEALQQHKKQSTDLGFLTVAKAFEILVEYAWRELKIAVEEEGLDAPSPKAAIKAAARLGWIQDPETWLNCIEARNNSVHDYFGISKQEYLALADNFLSLTRKLQFK